MNDVMVEKLIQKVINLTDEVNDVNIQVRRLSPPQEIINKIHERIDAIHAATGFIEQRLESDDKRLIELQHEASVLREEADKRAAELNLRLQEEADKREKGLEQRLNEKADWREKSQEHRLNVMGATLSRLSEELQLTRNQMEAAIHSLKEDLHVRITDHKLGLMVAGVLALVLVAVLIFK
jgi:regulator of protease activity HflC (stomatin/prohibitin superfamily)